MTAPKDDQNELDLVCGKSVMLNGEDQKAYDRLYEKLSNEYPRETFTDRLRIREMADAVWERFRFKRLGAKLVGAGCREALGVLLAPCVGYMMHEANNLSRDYYSDSQKRREIAKAQVDAYGITNDQIQAKALAMIAADFGFLDRLAANRDSSFNAIVKQHAKEQKRRAAKPANAAGEAPTGHLATAQSALASSQNPRHVSAEQRPSLNDNHGSTSGLPPRNPRRRTEV